MSRKIFYKTLRTFQPIPVGVNNLNATYFPRFNSLGKILFTVWRVIGDLEQSEDDVHIRDHQNGKTYTANWGNTCYAQEEEDPYNGIDHVVQEMVKPPAKSTELIPPVPVPKQIPLAQQPQPIPANMNPGMIIEPGYPQVPQRTIIQPGQIQQQMAPAPFIPAPTPTDAQPKPPAPLTQGNVDAAWNDMEEQAPPTHLAPHKHAPT